LLIPVVLANSALLPLARLSWPVVFEYSAPLPLATLSLSAPAADRATRLSSR
jgi:hypothetical protein